MSRLFQPIASEIGHTRNKHLIANFLDAMALPDTMAALRQYCHADCLFEVFHPFNTLVGVEAADGRAGPALVAALRLQTGDPMLVAAA